MNGDRRVWLNGHYILMEFTHERTRAHRKYIDDSCETKPYDHPGMFATWTEEVLEAVQAHGELRHLGESYERIEALRKELIQVGAMTEMWCQAIDDRLRELNGD